MNKRIQEFIDKQQYPGWMAPEGEPERIPVILFDKEDLAKFAELIVRECAEVSNQAEKQCQHPGTMIKQHFGVEE